MSSFFAQVPFASHSAGVDLGTVMVLPTGANTFYVRSTGPQSQEPLALSGRILSTLASALPLCRAGMGDTIVLLPGHTESVADATMLDGLVVGTRIVGVGRGANMPVFRWTATGSQWIMNDADVSIHGVRLRLEGANGVVKAIVCTAADCRISGCDIEVASGATAKATIAVEVGTGAARFEFIGNRMRGTATHNVTDGVLVAGVVDGVRITDNEMMFSATAAKGNVHFTGAATNTFVARNFCLNSHTSSTGCIAYDAVAVTGVCSDNRTATINDGTVTAQGVTMGAGCLVRAFDNLSSDEPAKSGVLTPGAAT